MSKIVFLVDDDRDDRDIFMEAVAEVNINLICKTAEDGEEALTILKSEEFVPDYIFLDLNMPRLNGKECLIEIKKLKHLDDVSVIIYTTSSSQSEKDAVKRLGASRFITKPSTFGDLCTMLSSVIYESKNIALESEAV